MSKNEFNCFHSNSRSAFGCVCDNRIRFEFSVLVFFGERRLATLFETQTFPRDVASVRILCRVAAAMLVVGLSCLGFVCVDCGGGTAARDNWRKPEWIRFGIELGLWVAARMVF